MKRYLICLGMALLSIGLPAIAQSSSKGANPAYIDRIVDSLTRNAKTDRDKVTRIYEWIRVNIEYDWKMYGNYLYDLKNYHAKSIDSILILKKGICFDFSNLAKTMFSRANVRAEIVEGYARYEDEHFFKQPEELPHAWNAVLVDNQWLFMDLTWASLSYNAASPVNDFFLMTSAQIIFTHYPNNERWRVSDPTITLADFMKMPIVISDFFNNIQSIPGKQGCFITEKEDVVIEDFYELMSDRVIIEFESLGDGEFYEPIPVRFNQNGKKFIKLSIPKPGKYYLKVLIKKNTEGAVYNLEPLIKFLVLKK